jgi:hypothetical protein
VKGRSTGVRGAGPGGNSRAHRGAKNAEAGVIEARPGIIESANIDPLHKGTHTFVLCNLNLIFFVF